MTRAGPLLPRWGFETWESVATLVVMVAVTFLWAPWLGEQRELPRHALLQLVAMVGLALHLRRGSAWSPGRWHSWTLGLGAALIVATAAATSPGRSLFGPYEGHFGAAAWLTFLALAWTVPGREALGPWCASFVAVGVVQAVLALVQQAAGRPPVGTMGHVVFLSGLCALAALVTLGVLLDCRGWQRRVGLLCAFCVLVGAMVVTARRGPLLALAAGLLVLAWSGNHRRWIAGAAAAAGVVVTALAGVRSGHHGEVLAHRVRDTLAGFAVQQGWDTVAQRVDLFRVAWLAFWERPWLGHGFGAFRDAYASGKGNQFGRVEVLVHNVGLELLLAVGLAGGVAAVVLVVAWVGDARRTMNGPEGSRFQGRIRGVAAMAVAYGVHVSVNLDQAALAGWAWLLMGFLVVRGPGGNAEKTRHRWAWRHGGVVAALALAAWGCWAVLADACMALGVRAERQGEPQVALSWFRRATAMAPHECTYQLRMALSLRALDVDGSASERTARLTDCARREPRNAFVHHHLGLALRERRGEEMSLVARSQALVELAMARDLAPGFAMFRQGLAHALAEGGALPAALHEMEEAVRLEGANAGYHSDRGNILALMGRTREAVVAYCKAGALDPTTLLYEENLRALERKELRALPCPGTEEAP